MNLKDVNKAKVVLRFLTDSCIIGAGGIVLLLFRTLLLPFERGFFCNDESLQYPFKESTVTSAMLYGIGFALGFVMIPVIEAILIFYAVKFYPEKQNPDIAAYGKLLIYVQDIYLSIIPFFFGAVVEHVVTDIGKYSIGRLRPHFFDVCNLNFTEVNCSMGYIQEFVCVNDVANQIREVRLSFPSGHASFSMFVAAYLMIYLQVKLASMVNSLILALLQSILFLLAWYTSLSRITDYKHHTTDVIAGGIIGIIVAIVMAYCVSDLFKMKETTDTIIQKHDGFSIEDNILDDFPHSSGTPHVSFAPHIPHFSNILHSSHISQAAHVSHSPHVSPVHHVSRVPAEIAATP